MLPISKDEDSQKDPEAVFQAITQILQVLTSYWNHIDEIYSDITQGNDKSIDKLDQCIKNLVEKCQCTEAENWYIGPSYYFMRPNTSRSRSGSSHKRGEKR